MLEPGNPFGIIGLQPSGRPPIPAKPNCADTGLGANHDAARFIRSASHVVLPVDTTWLTQKCVPCCKVLFGSVTMAPKWTRRFAVVPPCASAMHRPVRNASVD